MKALLSKDNGSESKQMVQVYSETLAGMFRENKSVMHLDADMMIGSNMNLYKDEYPDNIIQCGIAEGNMASIAGGLSAEGKIPFIHTFSTFASRRACDQLYVSCAFAKQNVKIMGCSPGITTTLNGGTHAAFEDIAIMRAIPGVTIIDPSDAVMLKNLLEKAVDTYGVFYIRFDRKQNLKLYEEGSDFEIGKAVEVIDGSDVTIIAEGILVTEAIKAADILKQKGISARVLDMFTIKPIDEQAIIKAARDTGCIVTAENHNIIGGLGGAVAEVLAENCPVPMERIGVKDKFAEPGTLEWLKQELELTAEDIVKKVEKVLSRKK